MVPTTPMSNNLAVKGAGRDDDGNFDILNMVQACLWKTAPFAEPILALEVRQGEYQGVVFSFSKFHVLPVQMQGGFVPTKYETAIHVIPPQLPKDWVPDEQFDSFTSEILFKWLHYINMNDLAPLLAAKTGTVH